MLWYKNNQQQDSVMQSATSTVSYCLLCNSSITKKLKSSAMTECSVSTDPKKAFFMSQQAANWFSSSFSYFQAFIF